MRSGFVNAASTAAVPDIESLRANIATWKRQAADEHAHCQQVLSRMRCDQCGHSPEMPTYGSIVVCEHLWESLRRLRGGINREGSALYGFRVEVLERTVA